MRRFLLNATHFLPSSCFMEKDGTILPGHFNVAIRMPAHLRFWKMALFLTLITRILQMMSSLDLIRDVGQQSQRP